MLGSTDCCTGRLLKCSCTYYCIESRRSRYLSITNEPPLSDSGIRPYTFQIIQMFRNCVGLR